MTRIIRVTCDPLVEREWDFLRPYRVGGEDRIWLDPADFTEGGAQIVDVVIDDDSINIALIEASLDATEGVYYRERLT